MRLLQISDKEYSDLIRYAYYGYSDQHRKWMDQEEDRKEIPQGIWDNIHWIRMSVAERNAGIDIIDNIEAAENE